MLHNNIEGLDSGYRNNYCLIRTEMCSYSLVACVLQVVQIPLVLYPLYFSYDTAELRQISARATDEETEMLLFMYIPLYSLVLEQPLYQWIPLTRSIKPYCPHVFCSTDRSAVFDSKMAATEVPANEQQ